MQSLQGKVALITGGSRGIGAAIAGKLASEGADVALTFVSSVDLATQIVQGIKSKGRDSLAIRADNTQAAEIEAAVAQTAEHFGRLDILVNSAGIFHANSIEQLTLDDFDMTMAINVRAAFIASKAAVSWMETGSRIISIGSNLAVRASGQGLAAYTTSKAALAGLTQALARDLGPRGITANIVHPGSTDTDMNPADGPKADGQRALMATTAGYADPSQIADVVAFLASPAARSITGAAWTIDNGANA